MCLNYLQLVNEVTNKAPQDTVINNANYWTSFNIPNIGENQAQLYIYKSNQNGGSVLKRNLVNIIINSGLGINHSQCGGVGDIAVNFNTGIVPFSKPQTFDNNTPRPILVQGGFIARLRISYPNVDRWDIRLPDYPTNPINPNVGCLIDLAFKGALKAPFI